MSHTIIVTIAKRVPTTVSELSELGLAENIEKEYGERLVKNVNAFVEMNKLHKYIEKKRASQSAVTKRQRVGQSPKRSPSKAPVVVDMTDDEFDNGIDYSAIDLPGITSSIIKPPSNVKKSSYFNGAAVKALSSFKHPNLKR